MSHEKQKEFRVQKSIRDEMRARKRRLERRLDKFNYPADLEQPMLRPSLFYTESVDVAICMLAPGPKVVQAQARSRARWSPSQTVCGPGGSLRPGRFT